MFMVSENLQEKSKKMQYTSSQHVSMLQHRDFLRYGRELLRTASLYSIFRRILSYLRRFRIAAIVLRAVTWIWVGIETGALFLLSTLLLLFLFPLLLFTGIGILCTALIELPRKARDLLEKTQKKRVYVLFLAEEASIYFQWNIRDLAANENTAVVLISPFYLFSRGIQKGKFYCTVRMEAPNIYLVRRYAFFYIRRHVLNKRTTAYLY